MEQWEIEALEFAKKAHAGDKDDAGRPYMEAHILPVVNVLKQITKDKVIIIAGYIHDTLEDTITTYEEIKDKFGKTVADIVNEVTKEGPSKNDYFPRLHSKKAIILKFADRLQNLSRMEPAWNEARQQRYIDRSKFWKSEGVMVEETYEETLARHSREIHTKQKICEHLTIECELDHSVIGRGSCTESIHVECVNCGVCIVVFDFHSGKDRDDLIRYLENGTIRLDWDRDVLRYDCDAAIYYNMENSTKDYLNIMSKLKKARGK